ncbi:penicillin acylase family protein [Spirochaetota bacterium]
MRKKILVICFSVFFFILIVIGGLAIFYKVNKVDHNLDIIGEVISDITIERTGEGTPFIKVTDPTDIYFALGYVHMQDRLQLMEYYRAISNGSLRVLIGEKGKSLDKLIKLIGLRSKAEGIEEKLPEKYLKNIEAYVKGINSYRLKKTILRGTARAWIPVDIISILLLREWSNAFLNNKEIIFNLPKKMQKPFMKKIFPKGMLYFYEEENAGKIAILKKFRKLINKYIGPFNRGYAFYVPGKNTKKGEPLSAYSYESQLNIYPSLYPVRIQLNELKINGITYAGLPFIFSGTNQKLSFYGFNLNTDTQDFIIEKIKTEAKNESQYYLSRNGWKKFKVEREPVYIKDNKKISEIVWATKNGPVIDGIINNQNDSKALTIKSVFPKKDYIISLFELPFSDSLKKARKAVKNINSLPRVYLFSSQDNAISVFSGKVPNRRRSNKTFKKGKSFRWISLKNISSYKNRKNKNTVIGSSFLNDVPGLIKKNSIIDKYRNNRIKFLLDNKKNITLDYIKKGLLDKYSLYAKLLTPVFIKILNNNPLTSARLSRVLFKDWDYIIDSKKIEPTIFYYTLKQFIYETYKDELGNQIGGAMKYYNYLIDNFYELSKNNKADLFDNIYTVNIEDRNSIFDRAFLRSMRILHRKLGPRMGKWHWKIINYGKYSIPLEKYSFFANLLFKVKDKGLNGGFSTVYHGGGKLFHGIKSSTYGINDGMQSYLRMDFAYSVNPFSEFYFGRKRKSIFYKLDNKKSKYLTRIKPDK